MEPGWHPGDLDGEQVDEALNAAARLLRHLAGGGRVEPIRTSLRLRDGEHAYADELMEYARFYGEDAYLHERPSSYLSPFAVAGSMLRNRVQRESAEPRWRDVHSTRVVITDRRIIMLLENRWTSLEHDSVAEFVPDLEHFGLVLTLYDNVPLRLRTIHLPSHAVLLAGFLFAPRELAAVPGFAVLA